MLFSPTSPLTPTIDNLSWDSTLWQPAVITNRRDHWLIQRIDESGPSLPPRFLQIATGQWLSASRATKFPSRHSAMAYADEYGLQIDINARLVRPTEAQAA